MYLSLGIFTICMYFFSSVQTFHMLFFPRFLPLTLVISFYIGIILQTASRYVLNIFVTLVILNVKFIHHNVFIFILYNSNIYLWLMFSYVEC